MGQGLKIYDENPSVGDEEVATALRASRISMQLPPTGGAERRTALNYCPQK